MHRLSTLLFIWISSLSLLCQTSPPKYRPGTVLDVHRHQEMASIPESTVARYDVTVQIDDTVYVVLYTPPYGSNTVEYSVGLGMLFAVGKEALILPGKRDGQEELPILRTDKLPPKPAIDWSRAPSQYFSMKMENLSTSLHLSDESCFGSYDRCQSNDYIYSYRFRCRQHDLCRCSVYIDFIRITDRR